MCHEKASHPSILKWLYVAVQLVAKLVNRQTEFRFLEVPYSLYNLWQKFNVQIQSFSWFYLECFPRKPKFWVFDFDTSLIE